MRVERERLYVASIGRHRDRTELFYGEVFADTSVAANAAWIQSELAPDYS